MNRVIRHLLLCCALCLASCQFNVNEQIDITPPSEQIEPEDKDAPFVEGPLVLGRERENPYSVENMRAAYSNLSQRNGTKADISEIQATHQYIKFKPKDDLELRQLLSTDSTILFYPYPLDRKIVQRGTSYHDPEVPDSLPTYQYASIKVGHKIPTIAEYEILADLYIPDDVSNPTKTLSNISTDELVNEALSITGNEDCIETASSQPSDATTRSWTPNGYIKVYDDIVEDYVPVPGARVRAVKWFTTYYAYTNTNGYFKINEVVTGEYSFSILWERFQKYDIRDGWFDQAIYNGPTKSWGWSLNIRGNKSQCFATMNRAAYKYYYGDREGLIAMTTPASSNLKLCLINEVVDGTSGDYWGNVSGGVLPDIRVYAKKNSTTYCSTHDLFGTTIHEMAHANHCIRMTSVQFWQVSKIVYESWARFVQMLLTYSEYCDLSFDETSYSLIDYIRDKFEPFYCWPKGGLEQYSILFVDLYDDFNQRVEFASMFPSEIEIFPNDIITGYSPYTLNSILLDSYGLTSLNANLKLQKPAGVTDAMLDTFFENYNQYE